MDFEMRSCFELIIRYLRFIYYLDIDEMGVIIQIDPVDEPSYPLLTITSQQLTRKVERKTISYHKLIDSRIDYEKVIKENVF